MKLLTERTKPISIGSLYGQDFSVEKLMSFVLNFKRQKKKSAIVYGPPGTGKTSSIYAIANDHNLEVVELNASEYRDSDSIEKIVKEAMLQKSLVSNSKIILIDDIEGMSGSDDRGGVQKLVSLIGTSCYPVIMTSNDPWDSRFSLLRKNSILIEFKSINTLTIVKYLEDLSKLVSVSISKSVAEGIALNSNGDLRAAINDFQTLSEGTSSIDKSHLGALAGRDKKETIFHAISVILKSNDLQKVLASINNTNVHMDEAILWLDENLPLEYTGLSLRKAYESLSKADIYKGRISRRQYFRFMVYQYNLMTAGVALAKKFPYTGFTNYSRSTRILKYWIAKNRNQKRKNILVKLSLKTHTSTHKSLISTLPYLKIIFQKNKTNDIKSFLGLDEDELEYLLSKKQKE